MTTSVTELVVEDIRPELDEIIMREYPTTPTQAGMSLPEIAAAYGYRLGTIVGAARRLVREKRLVMRDRRQTANKTHAQHGAGIPKLTDLDRAIGADYAAGASYADLMAKYGRTDCQVRKALDHAVHHGLIKRRTPSENGKLQAARKRTL